MIEKTIVIENAQIKFRNFAGKEGNYNPKGRRSFVVILDPDLAKALKDDGWNIRVLKPIDPEDDPQYSLQVAVSYEHIPPKIVQITSNNKTILDELSISSLDTADIENVDLIIRPYNWEVNGKKGIKAYVKSMYVTLAEDEFEAKYRNVPDNTYLSEEESD